MSRMLVTGATGFTGSAVCRRLREEGHDVVAYVRPTSHTDALCDVGVDCRTVDITDAGAVRAAFEPFDVVFHIAAAYRTEHADRATFRQVNVDATRHLLDAAQAVGVGRFVHCSTVGVQGEIEDPPADEDYRFQPGDHYQESKQEGELLARRYFESGLPGAVVRPVGIYGPGDKRFLKLFRPISRGTFVMIGRGDTLYHMTYIDDLVQGFLLAATHEAALGRVFTIGGPRYTTLRELVNCIADVLGRPHPTLRVPLAPVYGASVVCEAVCRAVGVAPPLYPRRVEFFKLDRAFTIERARSLLGYAPAFDLEAGLRRTAEGYRERGWL